MGLRRDAEPGSEGNTQNVSGYVGVKVLRFHFQLDIPKHEVNSQAMHVSDEGGKNRAVIRKAHHSSPEGEFCHLPHTLVLSKLQTCMTRTVR